MKSSIEVAVEYWFNTKIEIQELDEEIKCLIQRRDKAQDRIGEEIDGIDRIGGNVERYFSLASGKCLIHYDPKSTVKVRLLNVTQLGEIQPQ